MCTLVGTISWNWRIKELIPYGIWFSLESNYEEGTLRWVSPSGCVSNDFTEKLSIIGMSDIKKKRKKMKTWIVVISPRLIVIYRETFPV